MICPVNIPAQETRLGIINALMDGIIPAILLRLFSPGYEGETLFLADGELLHVVREGQDRGGLFS